MRLFATLSKFEVGKMDSNVEVVEMSREANGCSLVDVTGMLVQIVLGALVMLVLICIATSPIGNIYD